MPIAPGATAPSFALPATHGSTVSLDDLYDDAEAVIVAFWCNHCPYVQAWEDRFNTLVDEWSDKGLAAVAINSNDVTTHPADSFDAMSCTRSYRPSLSRDEVLNEIRTHAGTQFDPDLADAFLKLDFDQFDDLIHEQQISEAA